MAAIFVAELTIGIFAYRLGGETEQLVADSLNTTMAEYKNTTEITDFWDTVQKDLQCCGTKGAADWSPYFEKGDLPLSCCTFPNDATGTLNCNLLSKNLHNKPCLDALTEVLQSYASTIGLAGIIIAVVQLLGVIFACNLAHSIRNNYESV